ncbi:hypothetical protein LOTGIDRAFT_236521 [Lottia gigantea]|uniref:Uncharacterized protein n=1 Tax=Lottia gigantea TaxID=225164 RepID=V3ZHL0_LOTGI|nr:hypothetical protein LOTGIDRAFT_236521 [Lottia gigantea]ESO83692.1 hypothetical protein LOTGIDRAFT_236521 [Lottia gigantea]
MWANEVVAAGGTRINFGTRMLLVISIQMKTDNSKTYAFYDKTTMLNKSMTEFPLRVLASSLLFWIVLVTAGYFCYIYVTLFMQISDETDLSKQCSQFKNEDSNNFNIVKSYPVGKAKPYLLSYGLKENNLQPVTSIEQPLPFLVTAVTSAQFYQVQGLIRHIDQDLSKVQDLTFIIYDIGLTDKEYILVRDQCQCIVRKFRFGVYPEYFKRTENQAWRPIIVQEVLRERGSVILIEPTTRFKQPPMFSILRRPGNRQFYLWDEPERSVIGYTFPPMFRYFEEQRCIFKDSHMISTEIMVFYKSESTWHHLVKPWVICALNENCIAPEGARSNYCFHIRHPRTTGCHSFDQSALSIIANRAFQLTTDRNKNIPPRITFHNDEEEEYFEKQPAHYLRYFLIIIILGVVINIVKKWRSR